MKTNKIVGQALRFPGEMRRKQQQRWAGGAPALQILILLAALAFAAPLARTACTPPPPDMQSWFSGDDTANDHIWQPVGTLDNHATYATAKGTAPSQLRQLSFADRVAYQRAIEEVYWGHRIWPRGSGERPDPKPSLDAVMSQATIEKKVHDYLRNSGLLEQEWQKPITAHQLQSEMDRMAQHTKQPEVLRQLFAALGNDPFVIAECLARPVLLGRMINNSHVAQTKVGLSTPKVVAAAAANYTLPKIFGGDDRCTDDTWTPTSTTDAPDARAGQRAVWTGSEMIIWGGGVSATGFVTGGRYNPSTDSWTSTSTVNAPDIRGEEAAVWTGTEMIVWGGVCCDCGGPCIFRNTGGRYNPSTDTWVATTTTGAPGGRSGHTAVWTGTEMIVWGGNESFTVVKTGGRYNPNTDSWIATSTTHAPSARVLHTSVWTGSEMIVWGGFDFFNFSVTGGRYNPVTDTWMATSTTNAPEGRDSNAAVWTGTEMIVWGGGPFAPVVFNTGGRYNPFTDSWAATSTVNAPAGRNDSAAVWTGSEMIVWGGLFYDGSRDHFFNTGGRYDPSTDTWTATSTANPPAARSLHTGVWTGGEMIIWGGYSGDGSSFQYFNTGGRYCAQAGGADLTLESSFSRKTDRHNSFDVPLPGVEDRSDGKRFVIGFTFNNEVTGADSASTSCGTIGSVSVDPADSHTLLVTFNGQTCNQQEVTLTLTNVHDTLGNTLASAETSGCFLIGDVNGDGHVGNGDIGNIQGHLGEITDDTNFRDDINADGRINNQDVQAARAHRRESCP
jgi:N-acetylneuraminic acid mutarotase